MHDFIPIIRFFRSEYFLSFFCDIVQQLETFLKVLLFAPQSLEKCRIQQDTLWVETTDGRYEYPSGGTYPLSFTQKKLLGSVKLSYGQYTPYEVGQLPHYLFYEDGAIEAEMVLISLKK